MVPCKSTAEEVSFEWSHHRISFTDSKISTYTHVSIYHHRQPKLSMRVTRGTILRNLKMAVNMKDLYGNPGNRFKKINTRKNSQ